MEKETSSRRKRVLYLYHCMNFVNVNVVDWLFVVIVSCCTVTFRYKDHSIIRTVRY